MVEPLDGRRGPGDARTWTALLILAYVVVSLIGLKRTLLPDEIRPLLMAERSTAELVQFARNDIVQTPGSYVIAQAWLKVFGHTDLAAKALAIVVGAITLGLFVPLARRATPHWRVATLMLGLLFMRVGSSVNLVRMYGLVVLFSVAALLVWDMWREKPGLARLAGWAALMIAAIYMHPSALLLLGATTVAVWVLGPSRVRFTVAALVALLSLVPWINSVRPVYEERGVEANISGLEGDPTRQVAHLPFYFLTGDPAGGGSASERRYDEGTPSWLRWGSLLLALILCASAVPAIVRRLRSRRKGPSPTDDWLIAGLLIAGLPILVLWSVSMVTQPVVTARYLLCIMPAAVLAATELARLGGVTGRVALAAMLLWIGASDVWMLRLNLEPVPAHVSVERIGREMESGDLIMIGDPGLAWQFVWEWTRARGRTEPYYLLPTNQAEWLRGIIPATPLEDIDVANARRIWFMTNVRRIGERVLPQLEALGFTPDSAVQDVRVAVLLTRSE